MNFFRRHKFVFLFLALLVFSSVMVILQMDSRRSRHTEFRDAFIFLHTRGYTNEAAALYNRLLQELPGLSDRALLDDFRCTMTLVDPTANRPENLVWKYHWTVSNELEKRSENSLQDALKLAREAK